MEWLFYTYNFQELIRSWKTEVGHTQEKPWIVLRIAWHAEYALLRTMSHQQMIEALSLRSIFSSSLMEALSSLTERAYFRGAFCELQFFGRWTCVFRELNAELELWHSSVSKRLSNLLANWSILPNGVLATVALISLSECSPVALPCARFGMFWNKQSGCFWVVWLDESGDSCHRWNGRSGLESSSSSS